MTTVDAPAAQAVLVRQYGRIDDFEDEANAMRSAGYRPTLVTTVTAGPLKSAPFRARIGKDMGLGKQRLVVVYEYVGR